MDLTDMEGRFLGEHQVRSHPCMLVLVDANVNPPIVTTAVGPGLFRQAMRRAAIRYARPSYSILANLPDQHAFHHTLLWPDFWRN